MKLMVRLFLFSFALGLVFALLAQEFGPRYPVAPYSNEFHNYTPQQVFDIDTQRAQKGDTEAAWNLGLAYLQGYGTTQDLTKAEHWFEIGATSEYYKSQVAGFYVEGHGFPQNFDMAAKWYRSTNNPLYIFELGEAYRKATPPRIEDAIAVYLELLHATGHPEVRRAQMELGNLVLDGKYTAGNTPQGRALNMEWARIITQELLGQEEYKIAVDYEVEREGLGDDPAMWARYCKRAAAYNIDMAQQFYAQAIMGGQQPNPTGYDDIAWLRLASDKQTGNAESVKRLESYFSGQQRAEAEAVFQTLVRTRQQDGAYYPADDPLKNPTAAALAAMPQEDPDVQIRRAFAMEKAATTNPAIYSKVMDIYRRVRDRREIDIRYVLGKYSLSGTNGVPKNRIVAEYWLRIAAERGSMPAKNLLAKLQAGNVSGK